MGPLRRECDVFDLGLSSARNAASQRGCERRGRKKGLGEDELREAASCRLRGSRSRHSGDGRVNVDDESVEAARVRGSIPAYQARRGRPRR